MTLSKTLQGRLVTTKLETAKQAWDILETIIIDNKRTRAVTLKGDLRVIQLGDRTIYAFFQKLESIVTLLNATGSPLSNDDVVTYAIFLCFFFSSQNLSKLDQLFSILTLN